MNTCIECTHWSLKDTDRSIARMGFARCMKKTLPGHTVSAEAPVCPRFAAVDAGSAESRREWLAKQNGGRA